MARTKTMAQIAAEQAATTPPPGNPPVNTTVSNAAPIQPSQPAPAVEQHAEQAELDALAGDHEGVQTGAPPEVAPPLPTSAPNNTRAPMTPDTELDVAKREAAGAQQDMHRMRGEHANMRRERDEALARANTAERRMQEVLQRQDQPGTNVIITIEGDATVHRVKRQMSGVMPSQTHQVPTTDEINAGATQTPPVS